MCLKRDGRAWALLVEKYGRLVYWAILRELKRAGCGSQEAEDLFQSVWSRIWRGGTLASLKRAEALASWLVSAAVNETRVYLRFAARRGLGREKPLQESLIEVEEEGAHKARNPREEAVLREMRGLVMQEFDALPARERLVVKLFFEEGVRTEEIATCLGMPRNTVLSMISRVRQRVKDGLKTKGIQYE
ncbi:MAG: sigma-70 family RNA polymerase sigma factor [Candidatus Omnitrophica bacterium]|nr:sigma-70 family RNA polymerase sigma factor [Candidatus Omnitrophota bacterium]